MLLLAFTWLAVHPGVPISLLLLLPLIADGSIQAFTTYESRNSRRLWTGFLFGYGLAIFSSSLVMPLFVGDLIQGYNCFLNFYLNTLY